MKVDPEQQGDFLKWSPEKVNYIGHCEGEETTPEPAPEPAPEETTEEPDWGADDRGGKQDRRRRHEEEQRQKWASTGGTSSISGQQLQHICCALKTTGRAARCVRTQRAHATSEPAPRGLISGKRPAAKARMQGVRAA